VKFAGKYFDLLGQRFADLIGRSDDEIRRAGEELDESFAGRSNKVDDTLDAVEAQMLPGLFVSRDAHENAQFLLISRLKEFGVYAPLERSAKDGPQNVLERVYRAIAYRAATGRARPWLRPAARAVARRLRRPAKAQKRGGAPQLRWSSRFRRGLRTGAPP